MDHQWPVEIVDDKGGAAVGARVCLVEKSAAGASQFPYPGVTATHADKGGGKYDPSGTITPTEGEWLLLVSLAGKSPVVQRLELKKKASEFVAMAKGGQLAIVSLSATVQTVGSSKVRINTFRVTLYPATEVVAIAGMDYHAARVGGGTQFYSFAQNQAEAMRLEKKIHAGTIVTIFITSKIQRITRMLTAKGKWTDVEVAQLGNPASRVAPPAHTLYQPKVGVDIHITDFYKYLSEVGTARPGSVIEVGIFSHSWPGGPILYDTSEGAAFSGTAGRDPDDFDARAKDFNVTNMVGYPKLKDAMAPSCRWVIWGCSATTLYKRRSLKAQDDRQASRPADTFFVVEVDHSSGADVNTTEERTSELRHRHEMDVQFRDRTYMAAVANGLDVETRGASPGVGSDFVKVDGLELMMVNLKTYAPVYAYFKDAFSPDFVPTDTKFDKGYVDYNKLRKRPAIPRPAFSSEYYKFRREKIVGVTESSTLTFWNGKEIVHPTVTAKLRSSVQVGLVTAGKTGHLYVLNDSNAALSQAVYAQEDGHLFEIKKDAGGAWKVKGAEL